MMDKYEKRDGRLREKIEIVDPVTFFHDSIPIRNSRQKFVHLVSLIFFLLKHEYTERR